MCPAGACMKVSQSRGLAMYLQRQLSTDFDRSRWPSPIAKAVAAPRCDLTRSSSQYCLLRNEQNIWIVCQSFIESHSRSEPNLWNTTSEGWVLQTWQTLKPISFLLCDLAQPNRSVQDSTCGTFIGACPQLFETVVKNRFEGSCIVEPAAFNLLPLLEHGPDNLTAIALV